MAIMPDHDGKFVIHIKGDPSEGDFKTPMAYKHHYAIERNGYLNPGFWGGEKPNQVWINRTSEASSNVSLLVNRRQEVRDELHNRALNKLLAQLDVAENLFEAWYERREAYSMLISAGSEVLEFVTNWRKPTYWKNISKRARPSTLPEAWLAYNFGVKPLVQTIDTCLNKLAEPLPSVSFDGSAILRGDTFMLSFNTTFMRVNHFYKLGCTVQPNPNPNYALANIAGLTTPFSTAWSVIPWGWAVDYFVNVSQLLSNFEVRHPGITIKNGYTTLFSKGDWFGHHPTFNNGRPYYVVDGSIFYMERRSTLDLKYKVQLSFPPLGSGQFANLFSAIAITLKGNK